MRKLARGSPLTPTVGREEWASGLSVVELEGALRAPVSREVQWQVESLPGRGRRCVVLDLANVSDRDAAGLGELVRVYTLAAAVEGELWIRNPTGRARELLDLAGLFEILSTPSELACERCS